MSTGGEEGLRRSLRFVDIYALAVGGVIGTGIFFMPNRAAAHMGPAAVWAFLVAAMLGGMLVLCYAEAGSRFRGTGGAMTYSHMAFGDLVAFEVGWATWVSRVVSWAALANIFVDSLAALWPAAEGSVLLVVALFAVLTGMNLRGVGLGAGLNTLLTIGKIIPLLVFVAVGLFYLDADNFAPFAPRGYGELGETTVIVLYAYVGFEGLVIPAAEMRDPRRHVPRALILGMATVAVLYVAVWAVCTGTLPGLAQSKSPVGEAAATFMGPAGTLFVQVGIVVSVVGINAFMAFVTPRALYGLSLVRLLPMWFARVGATQVPTRAILLTSGAAFALTLTKTFEDLAVISVVARIAQYVPTCLAVLRLRRMADAPPAGFRVPGGPVLPVLAVAVCGWLLWETPGDRLLWGGVAVASGLLIYLPWQVFRRREA